MRGKGEVDAFLAKFWEHWRGRAWEVQSVPSSSSGSGANAHSGGICGSDGTVRTVGVVGILMKEQELWESIDRTLQEAFQGAHEHNKGVISKVRWSLSRIGFLQTKKNRSKAKEIVILAEKMRQKLMSGSNSQSNPGD
ncbi:hypothetical protein L6164_033322 [Bauhinia variegata]|uniref:Uncharacterized protein n=1 Tax=Bauhinia variegata TaxID=167791 RepID=A0ACB9KRM0_BAUVA|nr:hypothetical protein L6164_033322 [Bauhinia variegata]